MRGLGLLPSLVQRLQGLGRGAAGQALQRGCCVVQCLLGLGMRRIGSLGGVLGLGHLLQPLVLGQNLAVFGLQLHQGGLQAVGFGQQGGVGLGAEQLHTVGLGLQALQRLAGIAGALEHGLRNLAVNFRAGQLFQQFGAFVGFGFQKGRKPALCQQHGLGEAPKVQPGEGGNAFEFFVAVRGENRACASGCIDLCQLYLGCLQGAVHLVAGAALAPEGAVQAALHLERHFGQAVGGVARHQVVAAGAYAGQARCLVVQRQADGIEQRGLARARGAGDGKQAVARKRRLAKVQRPLAFEGVEVFQSQGEDFHAASASGVCSAASTLR